VNKKIQLFPAGIGISSLLVIFAALCLCVFVLLSVSTVQAHQRLGDSARNAVTGYYEADCQAHQILSQLRRGQLPEGVTRDQNYYSYHCPISQAQSLWVQVEIQGDNYRILRWQTVATTDWQPEDILPVWDGNP